MGAVRGPTSRAVIVYGRPIFIHHIALVEQGERDSMRNLHRAVVTAVALVLALAACSSGDGSGSGDLAGRTWRVAVYAGSWGESFTRAFVEPFQRETGAKVELVPGGPADWLTALRSSKGGTPAYDVVAFTPNVIPSAVSAGVVAPL